MNKTALKKYAPQARQDFIAAVTRRAETLGLNPDNPGTVEHNGDAMLINGQPFPASLKRQRQALQERIAEQGFDAVMDATAYTWFNRLVAIRYMELHDFLGHGYRVLSHPKGHAQPEILDHVADLDMPGLDRQHVLDLKLAGNRDEELYRDVLLAQCHALHTAMPFLFEPIDDATELLLPDGLLRTDSLIRDLVNAVEEASWQEVEIIGWLYQFYISEKKDQVIGKVVKSEDIPAATQLFTPNWIVKYLVQNSLGRLWLMANPTSTLTSQWEYYIQPAEQTPEVNAQLDELIQTRIEEDGNTLNPESLTLLDPACGSGHILVEAYDLLRDIYLERGYRRRDIPRLILEKNLYGLEIDDRAAQLAGFALLMRARADDRRLFNNPVQLNVHALQEPAATAADLHSALNDEQIDQKAISQLVETFAQAKTLGSLIQIPAALARILPDLQEQLEALSSNGGLFARDAARYLLPLVSQSQMLSEQYDAVVANPPYMGIRSGINSILKRHINAEFPCAKFDLYACFVERARALAASTGHIAMITMHGWMFLTSYERFRSNLLETSTIGSMAHFGARAFGSISGEVVQTVAFSITNARMQYYRPSFFRLLAGEETQKQEALLQRNNRFTRLSQHDFSVIPGSIIGYWCSRTILNGFKAPPVSSMAAGKQGMATCDNDRFLRFWHEVKFTRIAFNCQDRVNSEQRNEKWYPYCKGGSFRRWFGNNEYVVNWQHNGKELKEFIAEINKLRPGGRLKNQELYFRKNITYSALSSGAFSARLNEKGYLFDTKGSCIFADDETLQYLLAFLNSNVAQEYLDILCPTLDYSSIGINRLPAIRANPQTIVNECVSLAKKDWDSSELSWDFNGLVLLKFPGTRTLEESYELWCEHCAAMVEKMRILEERNNRFFIETYGLVGEVPEMASNSTISLLANPEFRYGNSTSILSQQLLRFQSDSMRELVSFTIGCMMGRYSLDAPGLIYAHAGNEGFDPSQYQTFPADADGIVPITDEAWFGDDGANRIREFVRVVWGEETEVENVAWLAESLGTQRGESADDTIRRYLSKHFYKDHLQTYKNRPIYWLFSSGKRKAFEALVYLHRYNAGTLSRMRMEYVVPLQSRMQSRIDSLEQDIPAAASSAETKRLQKQRDELVKQLDELRRFDESLRHYADQRITLDLDDGVKVNYGKFGDLLSEVKKVTGKK